MHTASYEFLMKPKESAGCHQTLSARVGSGDETNGNEANLRVQEFNSTHLRMRSLIARHSVQRLSSKRVRQIEIRIRDAPSDPYLNKHLDDDIYCISTV